MINSRILGKYLLELACVSKFDAIPRSIQFPDGSYLPFSEALLDPHPIDAVSLVYLALARSVQESFGKDMITYTANLELTKGKFSPMEFVFSISEKGAITQFAVSKEQGIPDTVEAVLKAHAICKSDKMLSALSHFIIYNAKDGSLDIAPLLRQVELMLVQDRTMLYLIEEKNKRFDTSMFYTDPLAGVHVYNERLAASMDLTADKEPLPNDNEQVSKFF